MAQLIDAVVAAKPDALAVSMSKRSARSDPGGGLTGILVMTAAAPSSRSEKMG